MAQPTFVTAAAASADGFATTVAVQIDLGSGGNIGLLVEAFLDGGGGLGEIPPMTIGGTLSGGTTTGSGAGALNVDGSISGGTSLTMETLIAGGSYLGTSGAARAGRIAALSLTGLQWVQLRAEYLGSPTGATKPFFICSAWSGVSAIAAGTAVAASTSSGALSQSVTTTADDVAAILLHTTVVDGDTFTPSGATVQRLRAPSADLFSGYNGLILEETGIAGTTALEGSFGSGGTTPYAGTKWAVTGITGGGSSTTLTADDGTFTHTGQDANLLFGRKLTADFGSFTLSGQDVTLTKTTAYSITADYGSFSLAGQDVAFQKTDAGSYVLTAEVGLFSLVGQGALASYSMNAEVGSFVIAGQEVTFSIGVPAAYSLIADAGSYSLTGQNARLDWSGAPIVPNRQAGIYMGMRIGL